MNRKMRDRIALFCAFVLLALLPFFLSRTRPIAVDLPEISKEEVVAQEEKEQKKAQVKAVRAKTRKIYACESDEDCIIVDKDPCGCLIGPAGVTAINALYTLEFNSMNLQNVVAKTCPDTAPSTEKECSATAQAVCQAQTCKIVY